MNILSQIVPGLRDARTPFTVGVLWALAGWIATLLLPASVWQDDAIKGIAKQLSMVPAELLIAVCLSVVYVLGMFLEIFSRVFRRILFIGIVVAIMAFGVLFAVIVTKVIVQALPLVLLVAAVVALFAMARKWRSASDISYGGALHDTVVALAEAVQRRFVGWKRDTRQALETDGEILDDLVRADLRTFLRSHESFLHEAVEKLGSGQTYAAAIACGVTVDDVRRLAEPGTPAIPVSVKTIGDLRLLRWRDVNKAPSDVKQILSERLAADTECRLAFADEVLDYTNLRVMLRRRMETADIAFRKEAPDVYLEYDRIKAEGEFRKSVGIPLAAVLVLAAYKWHLIFNAQNSLSTFWWMCAAAVAVAVFVTVAGTEREAKSRRLLHAAIADEVFALKRDDYLSTDVFVFQKVADLPKIATWRQRAKESSRDQLKTWWSGRQKDSDTTVVSLRADLDDGLVPAAGRTDPSTPTTCVHCAPRAPHSTSGA